MSFPTGLRDALSGSDGARPVTVRKIESIAMEKRGPGGEERDENRRVGDRGRREWRGKRFDINNASREDALRATYHYRVFGIQIPGSKNAL